MALLISPSEISWGVIYVDNGSWCHASLPRPVLRRHVIECKTDSAALTMLFQKFQFCAFPHPEERISSVCWDICSHKSRIEQRTQVVSHHTLIFSTVNIVVCIPRGLQIYNAVLLFHPPCTLSGPKRFDVLCSHLLHSCIIIFWLTYVDGQTHANQRNIEVTGDYVNIKRRNAYNPKVIACRKELKNTVRHCFTPDIKFWFKHHSVFLLFQYMQLYRNSILLKLRNDFLDTVCLKIPIWEFYASLLQKSHCSCYLENVVAIYSEI